MKPGPKPLHAMNSVDKQNPIQGPVDKPALASTRSARPGWYETHVAIGVTS